MLKLVHDTSLGADEEATTIETSCAAWPPARCWPAPCWPSAGLTWTLTPAWPTARATALVVANGYAREREVMTGAGMVEVKAPPGRRPPGGRALPLGHAARLHAQVPKVTEVLPVMYLRGLSAGDFAPALAEFFGGSAGLSASTVQRLTEAWQAEHDEWARRDLSGVDYV